MNSCLYEGSVLHVRRSPVEHRFRSRITFAYLDLGELDEVFRNRLFWSAGRRPAPVWFRRGDHFGDPRIPLDETVRSLASEQTGLRLDGPVRLLTMPRYWGFVFNPVSFHFCFASPEDREPAAVVAEVSNTPWGQRHCYVLTRGQFSSHGGAGEWPAPNRGSQWQAKEFHVSPFMRMQQEYFWRLTAPGEDLAVSIQSREGSNRLFGVTMRLTRRPINSWNLFRALLLYPCMTGEAMARIYWQALRLWWKRVPFVPHPFKGQPHGNQSAIRGGRAITDPTAGRSTAAAEASGLTAARDAGQAAV